MISGMTSCIKYRNKMKKVVQFTDDQAVLSYIKVNVSLVIANYMNFCGFTDILTVLKRIRRNHNYLESTAESTSCCVK